MKKSTKAALLSALVFPGVGHLFLKQYLAGLALVCASSAAMYYLITTAVERALQIVDEILDGGVQIDVTAITERVSQQPVGTDAYLQNIVTAVLIVCWLVGIGDAYRVGRLRNKNR